MNCMSLKNRDMQLKINDCEVKYEINLPSRDLLFM